ncbi:MAG TPA: hypothetical protein VMN76_02955 [Acidobacteriota bacterium]|nr:hypothetical protein [Acidobacteriota bacterium]
MSRVSEMLERFQKNLRAIVFFHLGSDAVIELVEDPEGIRVSLTHPRVRPFQMQLTAKQIEKLVTDPTLFEQAFLEQLTRHRRSH